MKIGRGNHNNLHSGREQSGKQTAGGKLRRSERMRIKVLICVLGLILLFLLLGGRLLLHFLKSGEEQQPSAEPTPTPHIPVVEELHNVWIMEVGEDNLLLFRDGEVESYFYGTVEVEYKSAGEDEATEGAAGKNEVTEGTVGKNEATEGAAGKASEDAAGKVPESAAGKSQTVLDDTQMELHLYQPEWSAREQVADVELTDGMITEVRVKAEKIHGTVLGADKDFVEIEGYGKLPLAEECKGYRLYDALTMCTQRDLAFGYDFADFVLDDGEVCGILMVREDAMEYIRVLIRTTDYGEKLHRELVLTADSDFCVRYGDYENPVEEMHSAGDEVTIGCDSAYFAAGRVVIEPSVLTGKIRLKNVGRSQGVPAYRGHLELVPVGSAGAVESNGAAENNGAAGSAGATGSTGAAENAFAVVNVLPLEEYLYCVVPSEMPANYPMEALKAQAICARTYAYGHMRHAGYPAYGAHVDDSAGYQVYNNISEQESTSTAVRETYGELLYTAEGELAGTYYYSTSCGVGSDANVWRTEAAKEITYLRARAINPSAMQEETGDIGIGEYLRDEKHFKEFITSTDPNDFESGEGWYRWTYHVKKLDSEYLCGILKKRYQANNSQVLTLEKGEFVSREIEDFSEIRDIYVASRGAGGVAEELVLETDSGTYKVITEHNIRYVLCDGETKVERQNGSKVNTPTLLPSGFFVIDTRKNGKNVVEYTLIGGGFGHGVGMSQNAARAMAKSGYSGQDILLFFYNDCVLQSLYPDEESE